MTTIEALALVQADATVAEAIRALEAVQESVRAILAVDKAKMEAAALVSVGPDEKRMLRTGDAHDCQSWEEAGV